MDLKKLIGVGLVAGTFTLTSLVSAGADVVTNDVASTAAGRILEIQAGSSSTVGYIVQNTNSNNSSDPQNSCNPADGTVLTIEPTGLPQGVTAPPATVTDCATTVRITLSVANSVLSGDYTVGHRLTDAGVGTYENRANFTLRVTTATNTAPSVPGAPAISAGTSPNSTGLFSLSWTASTDAEGNPITYTLEHKDNDDADFSVVASGLATNSYTFSPSGTEPEGTWVYRVKASDGSLSSGYSSNSAPVVVDKRAPNAPTAAATRGADYTEAGKQWWRGSVMVGFTPNGDPDLADKSPGSGVNSSTLSAAETFNTTGLHTASGTVADHAGNVSSPGTLSVHVDAANPTASFSDCPASSVLYKSTHTVAWSASDVGSGLATASSGSVPLDTSSVGSGKSVLGPAPRDNVGNTGTAPSCSYSVVHSSTGILQPINSDGSSVFKIKSTIPVKIQLTGGSAGVTNGVFNVSLVKLSGTVFGSDDEVVNSTSAHTGTTMRYDSGMDQYIFNLGTSKMTAGTYEVTVTLDDGTSRKARFGLRS